jgi:hypothetical protein
MSAGTSDSPSGRNTAADDGEMSIIRTVKRAFDTLESSPAKHSEFSEYSSEIVDSDSHIFEDIPERSIRRRIDVFQEETQESSQSDSLVLHEQQHSHHQLQNDARPFSIDYSGTSDQELELECIAAMNLLRDDVILYRTAKPSNELYKLKFGDWASLQQSLQNAAATFKSDSTEALRLRELSLCSDSKAKERFNIKDVPRLIKKAVDIIQKEFFPDLHAADDEEYWNAKKKRKMIPNAEQDSETMADYIPNPRMRSLIQSVKNNVPTIIELRNKEWFTARDLRALFDAIINYNSSIIKFDAEV